MLKIKLFILNVQKPWKLYEKIVTWSTDFEI